MALEPLISSQDPSDAVAAYYAWHHDGTRIREHVKGKERGIAVEATGPLGPVVILRASALSVVPALVEALPPGRLYLMAPWSYADPLARQGKVEGAERNHVFFIQPERFSPASGGATPLRQDNDRIIADIDGQVAATCRILWRSPTFAELAVSTEEAFRRRGLARAVMSTMISRLLDEKVTPLHIVTHTNHPSIRLARGLGFTQHPRDELAGYVGGETSP